MNKRYFIVSITSSNEDVLEKLKLDALSIYGCIGIEDFSFNEEELDKIIGLDAFTKTCLNEQAILKLEDFNKKSSSSSKLYFNDALMVEKFKGYLVDNKTSYKIEEKESKDWNESWKVNFKKIKVSNNIEIIPAWEKTKRDNSSAIYIYPGQGFGTGNHETTKMCLDFLNDIYEDKEINLTEGSVLDFGCGSGILGIASLRLLNLKVDFCDIDVAALDNCKHNIEINFDTNSLVGSSIVIRNRLDQTKKHKVIFANLLLSILLEEFNTLFEGLEKKGLLVVSGILNNQVAEIEKIFLKHDRMKKLGIKTMNDWSAVLLEKQ